MQIRFAVLALALAAVPLSAASAMPVSTFLVKADKLKAKGPLALFSGDVKLLMNQVKSDAAALRAERVAAKSTGKAPAFCPPDAGAKLSDKDVLAAMQAVPAPRRASTTTRDALKAFMVRRYPCRA